MKTQLLVTDSEGGMWWPTAVNAKPEAILAHLKTYRVAEKLGQEHSFLPKQTQPVHSVMFADGRVWDSHFGDWRPSLFADEDEANRQFFEKRVAEFA